MFKVLLRLVFLVHQIIGQSDIADDYAALYIKALQAGGVSRKSLSPQGSDISIINWVAVYADIAKFDAIVPYHPTAIAILAPVEKRLQNHSNCFNELITDSHQFSNLGKLLEISGKTDISSQYASEDSKESVEVHIFSEGHKILRNLPLTFDCSTYGQN